MKPYKIDLFLFFYIIFFQSFDVLVAQRPQLPNVVAPQIISSAATIYYSGTGEFDTYLAKNIPFEPVQSYWKVLQQALGVPLITRGEAHITVITPPEYYSTLRQHLTIEQINAIADSLQMQSMTFEIVCLGRGQKVIDGVNEQTYFFVVRSPALFRLRNVIYERYLHNGGKKGDFKPEHYFPHITVGFTKRDLHESDGIQKNDKTCIQALTIR